MAKGKKLSAEELEEKLESSANERKAMFNELCNHVSMGLSLESFSKLHYQTVERYFKTHSKEFNRKEFEIAQQKGRDAWEQIGLRQANGTCVGNSRTWFYNMSNRYNWTDKQQIDAKIDGQLSVNVVNYSTSHALNNSVDNNET